MDITNGLGPAVQAISAQIPGAIKALTDAGQTMEAQALQAAHDDLTQIFSEMDMLVQQVKAGLSEQQNEFFAALDKRLNGLTLTSKLTYPTGKLTYPDSSVTA